MNWVLENLPLIFSSGAIAIVLFVLKRALDWAEWKGKADKSITSTEGSIKDIKKDIRTIQEDIKRLFSIFPSNPFTTDSPIRLNDLGKTISSELDASDWAKGEAESLIDEVRGKQPFEIQDYCFEYVNGRRYLNSEDRIYRAQDSAYNHGLELGQVLRVVGIELRDALLKTLNLPAP